MTEIAPPVSIESAAPGILRFVWDEDGKLVTEYPARFLRASCRCASCVSETTGAQILDPRGIPDDIDVTRASLVGNYGVALDFSDGHTTGIYSWEYLADLVDDDDLRTAITGRPT